MSSLRFVDSRFREILRKSHLFFIFSGASSCRELYMYTLSLSDLIIQHVLLDEYRCSNMTRIFMVTISLVLFLLGSLFLVMLMYDLDVLKPSPRPSERLYSEDGEVHFVPTPSGFICRTLGRESIIGEGIKI